MVASVVCVGMTKSRSSVFSVRSGRIGRAGSIDGSEHYFSENMDFSDGVVGRAVCMLLSYSKERRGCLSRR